MSRVIKFRAWNTERNILVFDNEDSSNEYFDGVDISEIAMVNHLLQHSELVNTYVWMLYTGLLDCKGVEIYEGDILFWDGSVIGAVSFAYAEFIVGEGNGARNLCNAPHDQIEVIGNIHENPELLEAL